MAGAPEHSESVFEGAIFSVARERWPGTDHDFDVVRHLGAAAVLPVTPDGDVLLVEQFRPAIRRTLIELPAGLLDMREEPLACAARELFEETGYRHVSIEYLGGIYSTPGFSDEYIHLFWAQTETEPAAEPEDGIGLLRLPLAQMVASARSGGVPDAKTCVALLLAEARGLARVG